MPDVTIINDTQVPLNVCLYKKIRHLHFHYANQLEPGTSVILHANNTRYDLKGCIDDGNNRYSELHKWRSVAIAGVGVLTIAGGGLVYFYGGGAVLAGLGKAVTIAKGLSDVADAMGLDRERVDQLHRLLKDRNVEQVVQVGRILGRLNDSDGTIQPALEESHKALKVARLKLKKFLQRHRLRSRNWNFDRDRTIRITGGPNATIIQGNVLVQADQMVPFKVEEIQNNTVFASAATSARYGSNRTEVIEGSEDAPSPDSHQGSAAGGFNLSGTPTPAGRGGTMRISSPRVTTVTDQIPTTSDPQRNVELPARLDSTSTATVVAPVLGLRVKGFRVDASLELGLHGDSIRLLKQEKKGLWMRTFKRDDGL